MSTPESSAEESAKGADPEVEVLDPEIDIVEKIVASALTTYDPLAKEIGELKESVEKTVFDLTKTKENKAARSLRAKIKAIPGAIDKAYESWNQPRLRAAEKMREKRDELKDMVPGILAPLDKQIEVDEQRREDERVEAQRVEAIRVGDIRKKIAGISGLTVTMLNESSEKLDQVVSYLEQQEITKEVYEEFVDEAKAVLATAIGGLKTLKVGALDREQKERDLERLRLETEAKAKQDQIDREARAEEDRINAERIEQLRMENEAAAKKLRDDEAAANLANLENARLAAQDQQRVNQEQQDAFEDERKVANQIALIHGRVAAVAGMIDVAMIEVELQGVRDTEILGKTEDLQTQVKAAIDSAAKAIESMLERVKATNAILDAKAEASAKAKAGTAPQPQEAAAAPTQTQETVEAPSDAASSLEDALLDANAEAAGTQLTPEELAMHTIQETGGTARPPAYVKHGYSGGYGSGRAARQTETLVEPSAEQRAAVEQVITAKRPTDAIILHTLATTFGVTEREALDWLQDMDMFELANKMDNS